MKAEMDTKIAVKRMNGSIFEEKDLISFSFIKDAYTPYTMINAKVFAHEQDYMSISEIYLYINGFMVHHGLIDNLKAEKYHGGKIVTLSSRGFTSLLCQNQIEPGMIREISINDLMDSYYDLPYVTHENNSDKSNYIFVKNNSTMWDGIVNLSYKLGKIYPYIRGTNRVMISPAANPTEFSYNDNYLIASGCAYDYKRMTSHFNMADISGNYGNHTLKDDAVINRKIVRHKVFELDRQFLYDPEEALIYRDKYAKRGQFRYFGQYSGYNGEDLCDMVSFSFARDKRISRITVSGDTNGITTELSAYYDGFYSGGTL